MLPLHRVVPLALLVLFGWMALSVGPHVGVTADETAHLTAGYSYWQSNDYRLQPENGNLPQRWAALPLLVTHPHFPALNGSAWDRADVWQLGRAFFFQDGNRTEDLLAQGRAMIVLFGLALALTAYLWSRSLFGPVGGLVTLGLVVFCPHLLAHGALITSDMAAALGFMLALVTWWRLCHRITLARIAAAGAAAGFLALAKYSAVIFAPVALLMIFVRCCRNTPLPWRGGGHHGRLSGLSRIGAMLGAHVAAAALGVLLIWCAYGFRYSASPDGADHFVAPWSEVLIETPRISGSYMADGQPLADPVMLKPGVVQTFAGWARTHQLLPEAYLYGLAFTDLHARGRLAYFAGAYRETGWWEFFPVAFVLKTTLPVLLLALFALLFVARTQPRLRSRWLYRLAPLLIFSGVYWLFAITSHLNIGHRHLLPLYPALFIVIGVIGAQRRGLQSWWPLVAAFTLLTWHAVASWRVRPHYLTYFNEIAGGPSGGHRYLVDSSLDWGQGLPDLKAWLDAHPTGKPLYLSYFGSDEPLRFGITATRIGDEYFDYAPRPLLPTWQGGTYCISATMLHRVYTEVRGPWSQAYESAYRALAQKIAAHGPGHLPLTEVRTFNQLRFGRLCHFLEHLRPDATVGNTFFIYQLSDEEVAIALQAPWRTNAVKPHQPAASVD